ncbi:hypothetical protein [Trichothermofontia sp.]
MSASSAHQDPARYQWLLSGLTPLLLGSLVGFDALLAGLVEAGQASEEIFRGDRLPMLPFPAPSQDNN